MLFNMKTIMHIKYFSFSEDNRILRAETNTELYT